MRFLRRLGASLAALAVLAATPVAAEPALWVVRDADSTLYLFGTVHVLKPGLVWRSPKVAKAMADSGDLVLELVAPDDAATLQPMILQLGIDRGARLSDKLGPADAARLAQTAKALGMPMEMFEPMKPWLASLTLSIVPMMKAGYDPKSGVETVLTAEAKGAAKPITGLETMEQQLRLFADMDPKAELDMLRATLDDVDEAAVQIDAMVAAWAAGDVAALEAAFLTEMKQDHPAAYEVLIARRNRDWADQLKAKLAGSGVSFVAVGAGHLVGPDSVQAELARRGIVAERF